MKKILLHTLLLTAFFHYGDGYKKDYGDFDNIQPGEEICRIREISK